MEAAVRDRGIRTLDLFLTTLLDGGGLPAGLVVTLPKVTFPAQVSAMARLCEEFERAAGWPRGGSGSRSRSRPRSPSWAPTAPPPCRA